MRVRLRDCGDAAVCVEFEGDDERAWSAALHLAQELRRLPPQGVVAVLPGLRSVLVEVDPLHTTPPALRRALRRRFSGSPGVPPVQRRSWTVPVRYDGPDLAGVALHCGFDVPEVVRLHSEAEYRVAMLGNLPGLPYLQGLPAALQMPRRSEPRPRVPAGSVAIVGGMSCVYPVAGPGGWQLIGRTELRLFDPMRQPPALLAPGDRVRFEVAG